MLLSFPRMSIGYILYGEGEFEATFFTSVKKFVWDNDKIILQLSDDDSHLLVKAKATPTFLCFTFRYTLTKSLVSAIHHFQG